MVFLQVILIVVVGQLIVFVMEAFNFKDIANLTQIVVSFICIGVVLNGLYAIMNAVYEVLAKL